MTQPPTLETLLRMPWTIQGPIPCTDISAGTYWYEMRIAELPDFFVADENRDKCVHEYMPALTAFLASYTEHGEAPPVSPAVLWKWLALFTSPAATTNSGSSPGITSFTKLS